MASTDLLSTVFHVYFGKLSKKERILLEMVIFDHLYQELIVCYTAKNNHQMEDSMISGSIIRSLVNDLLINNDYSLHGLAMYTGYPEDVIYDLVAGINNHPTLTLSTKILELHIIARRDYYRELIKKIIAKLATES